MNTYNISVTITPSIFVPPIYKAEDAMAGQSFYNVFIRMLDNYHIIFEVLA